jgi:sugar lactone lactonase YvrE
MKKRGLTIIVLVILGVIIGVILFDFLSNRPDRRGSNPYALEVDHYKVVDEELISHEETRNFSLGLLAPAGIDYLNDSLYIAGESSLAVISRDGSSATLREILPHPTCIEVDPGGTYIGYKQFVAKYSPDGTLLKQWEDLGERAVITSLAVKEDRVYVADAGNRRVVIFNTEGEILGEFQGKAESDAGHGFIVPSANFDLVVDAYGELWVVNPGKHALENYSDDGRLRGYWENASYEIDGFLGCCNPARIAALPDGSILTSEKGLVRIKIYDQSGKLQSVVAPPSIFKEEGKAPDVCIDEDGTIYALDFDKDMVRIFEPRSNG